MTQDHANATIVSYTETPDEATEIAERLGAEIAHRFGPRDERPFSLSLRSGDVLLAGLNGVFHWRWLYVRRFFVMTDHRGKGLGRALMADAERRARSRGCVGVYLDTFDDGAERFYQKLGFKRCGTIENFPPGATRRFLAKSLL